MTKFLTSENYLEKLNEMNFPKLGTFWYAVFDNFLPPIEFAELKECLSNTRGNPTFPWYFEKSITGPCPNENPEAFYFVNLLFDIRDIKNEWNSSVPNLTPFTYILKKLNIMSLMRIKVNMYMKTYLPTVEIHAPHIDYNVDHIGALFFLTTCNAPTMLEDGTPIESKENRMLFFNASRPHSSGAPTDVLYRQTINFNYFGDGTSDFVHAGQGENMTLAASKNVNLSPFLFKVS